MWKAEMDSFFKAGRTVGPAIDGLPAKKMGCRLATQNYRSKSVVVGGSASKIKKLMR
jgi:hypothetical protein